MRDITMRGMEGIICNTGRKRFPRFNIQHWRQYSSNGSAKLDNDELLLSGFEKSALGANLKLDTRWLWKMEIGHQGVPSRPLF